MKYLLIGLVNVYRRLISPLLPRMCRFDVSCSAYAKEALMRHGAFKGSLLAGWRILRCNPFNKSGPVDPVPTTFRWFGRGRKRDREAAAPSNAHPKEKGAQR